MELTNFIMETLFWPKVSTVCWAEQVIIFIPLGWGQPQRSPAYHSTAESKAVSDLGEDWADLNKNDQLLVRRVGKSIINKINISSWEKQTLFLFVPL